MRKKVRTIAFWFQAIATRPKIIFLARNTTHPSAGSTALAFRGHILCDRLAHPIPKSKQKVKILKKSFKTFTTF